MLDHRANGIFKLVVVVVIVGLYTIVLFTSRKRLSVSDINKNQIRNE